MMRKFGALKGLMEGGGEDGEKDEEGEVRLAGRWV